MERLLSLLRRSEPQQFYEPLEGGSINEEGEVIKEDAKPPFSWLEYGIFFLLGISMLWAWNMFMAAGPYFQRRFRHNDWILAHFQSSISSVSTSANLAAVLIFAKLNAKASYPKRIICSFVFNIVTFTLLALSAVSFDGISSGGYFGFVLLMVLSTSFATGINQNGVFSFVSNFERGEYMQAIMTGQAIAGVLPCIAQIVTVLSIGSENDTEHKIPGEGESSKSAFSYFLTATVIAAVALLAFLYLLRQHYRRNVAKRVTTGTASAQDAAGSHKKAVGLWTLLKKLRWLAASVFLCFGVTMFFPVFTQEILSVQPDADKSALFQPAAFIPLALLFWNAGDLVGRLLTIVPQLVMITRPKFLFAVSVARILFIPLYLLCNRGGRGAAVNSDFFYLVIVQLGFGVTNGWLGSNCMMGSSLYVDDDEREAAGGFMGLALCSGLAAGSLLSFLAASS